MFWPWDGLVLQSHPHLWETDVLPSFVLGVHGCPASHSVGCLSDTVKGQSPFSSACLRAFTAGLLECSTHFDQLGQLEHLRGPCRVQLSSAESNGFHAESRSAPSAPEMGFSQWESETLCVCIYESRGGLVP